MLIGAWFGMTQDQKQGKRPSIKDSVNKAKGTHPHSGIFAMFKQVKKEHVCEMKLPSPAAREKGKYGNHVSAQIWNPAAAIAPGILDRREWIRYAYRLWLLESLT